MLRNISSALRKLTNDQRGNNLIAYALILGAVGIAGAGYLANVSTSLKAGLNHQGEKIAKTAGKPWPAPGSTTTSPATPANTKPTAATPTGRSGTSGKGTTTASK